MSKILLHPPIGNAVSVRVVRPIACAGCWRGDKAGNLRAAIRQAALGNTNALDAKIHRVNQRKVGGVEPDGLAVQVQTEIHVVRSLARMTIRLIQSPALTGDET